MAQAGAMVLARLVVMAGDRMLRRAGLSGERVSIGRREYNDVVLEDMTVSGEHAIISLRADRHLIRDLGSRNGTLVNGERVRERELQAGDQIGIGVYRLTYERIEAARARGLGARREPALDAASRFDAMPARLEVLNGSAEREAIELTRPVTRVGLGSDSVAVIARRRGGCFLTHLKGASYPLIDGESIGLSARRLTDGDLITVGATTMRFRVSS